MGKTDKPHIDLHSLRKRKGWTQLQAAEALGFCRSYISDIESGRRNISKTMIYAIIHVFEVKYDDFYPKKE